MQSRFTPAAAPVAGGSSGSSTPVFILDIGTRSIKAGLHTAAAPHVTPSVTGMPKYPRCLPGPSPAVPSFSSQTYSSPSIKGAKIERDISSGQSVVIGHDARHLRGLLRLAYPVQRGGAIAEWEGSGGMRPLLRHSIHAALAEAATAATPQAHHRAAARALQDDRGDVIYSLVESPFASRPQRARLAEMLFEGPDSNTRVGPRAAGVFCGVAPLLALYATGHTTGLVVDVGDGGLSTAAAVDGYVLPPCLQHDVGGAAGGAVTSYLTRLLYQSGVLGPASALNGNASRGASAGTAQERELVYDVKEACCSVAPTPLVSLHAATAPAPSVEELNAALLAATRQVQEIAAEGHSRSVAYTLPDGHTMEIGAVEAVQASEVLFYPSLLGLEGPGVVDAAMAAVTAAPAEVQSALLGNIVLTGGATCAAGFGKRVFHELQERVDAANTDTAASCTLRGQRVCVTAPEHRAHAGWLGASFVAQLSTFASHMVVSRAAYEEEGEAALAKKVLT